MGTWVGDGKIEGWKGGEKERKKRDLVYYRCTY